MKELIRYNFLHKIAKLVNPKTFIEIGVAAGDNAVHLLKNNNIERYDGYDVFDYSDKEFHKRAGNGKECLSENEIYTKLSKYCENVILHKGMTSDTLWGKDICADMVWIDGDHRIEAIKKDFESVKRSKVIVFDDYYITGEHAGYTTDKYGCNHIVDPLDILITPPTIQFPNIRIAILVCDATLKAKINSILV